MATNDDDDRTQYSFWLGADTKEDWESAVDESRNHATLAAFIRYAVNKEIDDDEPMSSGTGMSEDVSDRLSELADGQRRQQETLADLADDIAAIKEQTAEPSDELQDLAGDVFTALPTEQEATWRLGTIDIGDDEGEYHGPETGRVADLADEVEAPRYRVRDALNHLQESSSMVRTTVEDGETRYYRRD